MMAKAERSPERTCCGCGRKRPQRSMVRVALPPDGVPVVDRKFRAAGRGAYLCRDQKCVSRALARRALERSLKLKSSMPEAMRVTIAQAIKES